MYLETERVKLREFCQADESNLYDLDSDPEVMRYLTNGVPSSKEWVKGALERIISLTRAHGGQFGFWAAIEKESNAFMGWFHFRPGKNDPDNLKRIELGYRLRRVFWGKGYATEVSRALIAKGFDEFAVEEVFALTMKANLASQRVMKKSGLSFVREFFNDEFPGIGEMVVEFSISKQVTAK